MINRVGKQIKIGDWVVEHLNPSLWGKVGKDNYIYRNNKKIGWLDSGWVHLEDFKEVQGECAEKEVV